MVAEMARRIRRLFSGEEQSTAAVVSEDLLKGGVQQANITGEHIGHVYSSLKRLASAPDFTSVDEILPNRGEVPIDTQCPVCGVIVETREHPAIDRVVNNFVDNVQVPIQIFHGNSNLEFIMSTSIAKLARDGRVHLTRLATDDLAATGYNALFLSQRFWDSVIGRKKILIFQTDTISCKHSDYTLGDFASYDYIGSKWRRQRPVGLIIDGGSGGLSLRDWEKTHECLSRFPPQHWCGGEDGYFAFHIELMGGKVGRGNECAKFSTESEFLFKSWGGHKISCLSKKAQAAFLDYCQDARVLLVDHTRQAVEEMPDNQYPRRL
jgi:hypothetical protein